MPDHHHQNSDAHRFAGHRKPPYFICCPHVHYISLPCSVLHISVSQVQRDGNVRSCEVEGGMLATRGVVDLLGSAKPFLDICYVNTLFTDGFDGGSATTR